MAMGCVFHSLFVIAVLSLSLLNQGWGVPKHYLVETKDGDNFIVGTQKDDNGTQDETPQERKGQRRVHRAGGDQVDTYGDDLRGGDDSYWTEEYVPAWVELCLSQPENSDCDYSLKCKNSLGVLKNGWREPDMKPLCEYCVKSESCQGKCSKNKCFLPGVAEEVINCIGKPVGTSCHWCSDKTNDCLGKCKNMTYRENDYETNYNNYIIHNRNNCEGDYTDQFCTWKGPNRKLNPTSIKEINAGNGVPIPLEKISLELQHTDGDIVKNFEVCVKSCKRNYECKAFEIRTRWNRTKNKLETICELFKSGEIGLQEPVEYFSNDAVFDMFAGICDHPMAKCSPEQTCKNGEGDCDNDDDCEKGLICGRNNCKKFNNGKWWEDNYPDMKDTADCCTKDIDWDHCTPNTPCGEERGDCDRDKDCKKGLSCKKCRYGNRRAQCCRK